MRQKVLDDMKVPRIANGRLYSKGLHIANPRLV